MPVLKIDGGVGDGEKQNLTGSCSLLTLRSGTKVIIDFGAHQGTDNDDKYNSQINKDLLSADYLILTHSHIDHGGRLPFLLKQGFKGEIIMTEVTRDTLMVMLLDTVRVNRKRIQEATRIRESEEKEFNKYLKIIKISEQNNNNVDSTYFVRGRNSNVNSVIELKDKAYEYFRGLLSSGENLRNFKEFFVESSRKNKKSNKCSRKDLPSLKDRLTQIPELLFTEEDIEDIKKRIIINNVGNILNLKSETTLIPGNRTQSTKTDLKFLNAGHIEGSVQAQITETSLLVSKALLPNRRNKRKRIGRARGRIKTKIDRYVFSGDLGRLTYPNLAGKPDIPKENINFLQIEGTYSGRNHPEKEQSVRDFFSAIENAPGKVLIPCFSMQRTQEILMLILEEQKRIVEKISQLNREIRAINVRINNIHTGGRKRAELNREIGQKEKEIDSLEKKVRDSIFVDGFISKEITEIYLKRFPKKYRLLLPDVQRKIFGKEIVKYLSFGEYNNLYGSKKTGKGQPMFGEDDDLYKSGKGQPIIISGSGMCQGGAIMNHLPKILPDKNATIVFVGYTTNNTNGGRIKERKSVKLHGKSYGVKCNTVDIKGFSAHIDQSDILKYISQIKFSLGAVLSINHGGPERQELAEEVRQLENVIKSEVNVIVPNCGDKIKL